MKQVRIAVDDKLLARLDRVAHRVGVERSELVAFFLREGVHTHAPAAVREASGPVWPERKRK